MERSVVLDTGSIREQRRNKCHATVTRAKIKKRCLLVQRYLLRPLVYVIEVAHSPKSFLGRAKRQFALHCALAIFLRKICLDTLKGCATIVRIHVVTSAE